MPTHSPNRSAFTTATARASPLRESHRISVLPAPADTRCARPACNLISRRGNDLVWDRGSTAQRPSLAWAAVPHPHRESIWEARTLAPVHLASSGGTALATPCTPPDWSPRCDPRDRRTGESCGSYPVSRPSDATTRPVLAHEKRWRVCSPASGRRTAGWCNGSTGDFESLSQGSNPCPVTTAPAH